MSEPDWLPVRSASTPINGGITAPPDTPVIRRPDISLAFSGLALRAAEYMMENMLEQRKPMSPMRMSIGTVPLVTKRRSSTANAPIILYLKYLISLTLARRKEPAKAPAVRQMK